MRNYVNAIAAMTLINLNPVGMKYRGHYYFPFGASFYRNGTVLIVNGNAGFLPDFEVKLLPGFGNGE
jgi:hypothetical protein